MVERLLDAQPLPRFLSAIEKPFRPNLHLNAFTIEETFGTSGAGILMNAVSYPLRGRPRPLSFFIFPAFRLVRLTLE